MFEVKVRTALVTGAAGGIGRAIADRFERDGWVVFRFDVTLPNGMRAIQGDVRSQADWGAVAKLIEEEVGRLDVLVNNAGILREAPLGEMTLDMWNEVMAVNMTGTFLGCRTMLPLLQKGKSPTILNLGSIDALRGSVGHCAYAASKGGIVSLTRALALELADQGIRVNSLCPGTVDTPMQNHMAKGGIQRAELHPLKRISTVEDQAAAATFLCGPESDFITGVALSVDGGRAIR